jgi:hypothetical protein
MTNGTKGTQVFAPMMAWLVPAAVAGVGIVGAISYIRSQETQAASGSPLYGKAVHEAIEGLKNPAAKVAVARPPLPAGLSPEEHYWCEQCKAYHKRQPGQTPPPAAGATPPPVAGGTPVMPGTPAAAAQPAGPIPPLAAGLSPDDYYWCANCKTYHQRQPAGAAPPLGAGDNPAIPAAVQPAGVIPPLPAGLSAADYYWCANCKTYHKRQPAAAVPASGPAPAPAPAPAPETPATPGHAPVTPAPVMPAVPVAPVEPAPPEISKTPTEVARPR